MTVPARVLVDHYRCPASFFNITLQNAITSDSGFFRFGSNAICYGRSATGYRGSRVGPALYDVAADVQINQSEVCLPFSPTEIIENLRLERYNPAQSWIRRRAKKVYYHVRPYLHRSMRKQVQRLHVRGWRERRFPAWPVDVTVENLCEQLLLLVLRANAANRIPFIWFWPDGSEGCVVMTHDVEGAAGRDYCASLMDIDDSYGIKASFNVVPQGSYSLSHDFLARIRDRGFEIGIQDLTHDGRLFDEHGEFLRRANLINQYANEYGAKGFRSAVLYRRPEWYDALNFSYDTSIPNNAHLDPQRGGCCTVMPYFIGGLLELPVTTTQDYTLFHLLSERSIELWKTQIGLVLAKNGLVSFIIHPDYVIHHDVKDLYIDLLSHLRDLHSTRKIWLALPSEVDRWWRARNKMELIQNGRDWRIEGEGSERAMLAYARIEHGRLVYELQRVLSGSSLN
ncbi:MAG: hypothetical protein JWN74_1395 [Acidobacteriaceae bacterium]|nr:hypothetical protein [Acidobacteriaceae bacterium]